MHFNVNFNGIQENRQTYILDKHDSLPRHQGRKTPAKNSILKVHIKYVKCWGVKNANKPIAFFFAGAFCVISSVIYTSCFR